MEQVDPVDLATRLVKQTFPEAQAGLLAGSVLTERRTATSDLDVVVVLDGPPAPYRETLRTDGWVVELFVHTAASLRHYWTQDAAARRPVLLRMCAEGHVVASRDGAAERYAEEAAAWLLAGPAQPARDLVDRQRYMTTDLLDDLRGAADVAEAGYIAAALMQAVSDLLLLTENRWSGTGKWLARQLSQADAELPTRLVAGQHHASRGDTSLLQEVAVEVLHRAGGPLTEGYRAQGEDPS